MRSAIGMAFIKRENPNEQLKSAAWKKRRTTGVQGQRQVLNWKEMFLQTSQSNGFISFYLCVNKTERALDDLDDSCWDEECLCVQRVFVWQKSVIIPMPNEWVGISFVSSVVPAKALDLHYSQAVEPQAVLLVSAYIIIGHLKTSLCLHLRQHQQIRTNWCHLSLSAFALAVTSA